MSGPDDYTSRFFEIVGSLDTPAEPDASPVEDLHDVELHVQWPKTMARIDAVIAECQGDYTAVLRALEGIAPELAPVCQESADFTDRLGPYVYEQLGFSPTYMMGFRLIGKVHLTEQTSSTPDPTKRVSARMLESLVGYGEITSLFVAAHQGEAGDTIKFGAYLKLRSRAPDVPEGYENIMCATESIHDIWGTQLRASIGSAATADVLKGQPPALGEVTATKTAIVEAQRSPAREIKRLEAITALFTDFIAETQDAQNAYPTKDMAKAVAARLTRGFEQRLAEASIEPRDIFEAEGIGVVRANLVTGHVPGRPGLWLGAQDDPKERIAHLTTGEVIRGTFAGFYAGCHEAVDESGEAAGYVPAPKLLLRTDYDTHDLTDDLGMIVVTVEQRTQVDLDGDAGISLPRLKLEKDRVAAVKALHKQLAEHPVRTPLDTVIKELETSTESDPKDLRSLTQLAAAAKIIDTPGEDLSIATEVLRRGFIERHLHLVVPDRQDGESISSYVKGRVIDVLEYSPTDTVTSAVSFVVETVERVDEQTEVHTHIVPIATIQSLVY